MLTVAAVNLVATEDSELESPSEQAGPGGCISPDSDI